ncbi:MAG: hypothetical protein M1536_00840 [Firmicutes bacterium]|nr:hypothetical protein [Bacillota bacterium]
MQNKNFRFSLKFVLLMFLSVLVLSLALVNQASSQEQPAAASTPAAEKEPAIKAGPSNLLPTARNLSDIRAMIYPQKSLYEHKYHAKSRCGVLGARLELIGKHSANYITGIYYLKGVVTLRVKIDKKHSGYGLTNGNGVKFFVDGKLFTQNDFLLVKDPAIKDKNAEQEWENIWEWQLDTTRFPDGKHTIAVNVCDHFDHYGIDSIDCYFVNKEK